MSDDKRNRGRGKLQPIEGPKNRTKNLEDINNEVRRPGSAGSELKDVKTTKEEATSLDCEVDDVNNSESEHDLEKDNSIKPEAKTPGGNLGENSGSTGILENEMLALHIESPSEKTVTSKLSPYAKEFVPQSMNQAAENFTPEVKWEDYILNVEDSLTFCYTTLADHPGRFSQVMETVSPHFKSYLQFTELCNKIVEDTFNLVMSDHHFSFMCVKVLVYLATVCQEDPSKSGSLRHSLLTFCQRKLNVYHQNCEQAARGETGGIVIPFKNFLLFLSELYNQLEVGEARLVYIGRAVTEAVRAMIKVDTLPIQERFSDALSIVKLTGVFLDTDDNSILDRLISELGNLMLANQSGLSQESVDLLHQLVQLRASHWENLTFDEPLQNPMNQNPPNQNGFQTGYNIAAGHSFAQAVFYGPDGLVLAYEEQQFLEEESYYQYTDEGGDMSPPMMDGMDGGMDGMDGEMEDAYDEFLMTLQPPNY